MGTMNKQIKEFNKVRHTCKRLQHHFGLQAPEAYHLAKWHTATAEFLLGKMEEAVEREIARKRHRCRYPGCRKYGKGLKAFCRDHEFTMMTGYKP